jgi:hypothetical protein
MRASRTYRPEQEKDGLNCGPYPTSQIPEYETPRSIQSTTRTTSRRENLFRTIGVQKLQPNMDRWDVKTKKLFVPNQRIMRATGGMTGRHNEKRMEKFKDSIAPPGFDVDGDGHIDENEMKIAKYLKNVHVEDMDGDGDIDEDDVRLARMARGKQYLAEDFMDKIDAPLWMYDRKLRGVSRQDMVNSLVTTPDFPLKMSYLNGKERLFKISSSNLMKFSIMNPETSRLSARPVSQTGFFKETRASAHDQQIWDATMSRNKKRDFCRNKGDIIPYGNFANYRHICTQQGVNPAATGH